MQLTDLTGTRFENLVVLSFSHYGKSGKGRQAVWNCRCDCGFEWPVRGHTLKEGRTKRCRKCGHLIRKKHGMIRTPEYRAWAAMKSRCQKTSIHHAHYFDRGISVCAEWLESFASFFSVVGARPSSEHTLERVDNDKGYQPGNVKWATQAEQNRNRTDTIKIRIGTETVCGAQLATMCGVHRKTIYRWIARGLTGEEILSRYS